jgi:hypothetical protein
MTLLGTEADFTYANNEGGSLLPPKERVAELQFRGMSQGEAMREVYGGSLPAEHVIDQAQREHEARLAVQRALQDIEQR